VFLFYLVIGGQLVGLGGFHRKADDLIGLSDLGQRHLGDGWEGLQAWVEEGVGRVAGAGGGDLGKEEGADQWRGCAFGGHMVMM